MSVRIGSGCPSARGQDENELTRVVLLLEELNIGGTQRQALELALNLDTGRFHTEIWLMAGGEGMRPLASGGNVPIVHLSGRSIVGPDSLLNLWRMLRSNRVDVLVLMTVIPNIWGRLLGRLAGVPVIIGTCRGDTSAFRQHEKLLKGLVDHHICNAGALKKRLASVYKVPDSAISVIPNGVNTQFFRPPETSAGRKAIICPARLVPEKDHDTLISAFGAIASSHPETELWIVGDGPRRKAIEELSAREAPAGKIRLFPGHLDLRPLFAGSCLLVLSSVVEGLPNAVLEAMACGLPVLATDVGGLREVVEHGRTGFLVPSRNVTALAEAMNRLLQDENLRETFGREGRRRAEELYSVSTMVRRHEEIFQKLLSARGRNGLRTTVRSSSV